MRPTLVILIVCFGSLALADDFKTIDGSEYKNAKVSRVEPDGIVITFSGGIVKIPFTELSPDIQKKYGYDAQAAAAFQQQTYQGDVIRTRQLAEARQKRDEETAKYWSEHPTPVPVQPQSVGGSMHGTALDARPAGSGGTVVFIGRVVSVVEEGQAAILAVQFHKDYQLPGVQPGSAVYVRGNFQGAVDGTKFKIIADSTDNVQYHTAIGGLATVRGFVARNLIPCVAQTYGEVCY